MNKKFLSALLFGAVVTASTSTFVSCKDYDDDIDALQEQITTQSGNSIAAEVTAKFNAVNAEITALKNQQAALQNECDEAKEELSSAIQAAKAEAIEAASAKVAAAEAALALTNQAVASLESAVAAANARIDAANAAANTANQLAQAAKDAAAANAAAIAADQVKIAGLVDADAKLQTAVETAQAKADQAYTLAEKAATKEALAEVVASLDAVESKLQGEIDAVAKKAIDNEAAIEAQAAIIESIKASNQEAVEALKSVDAELAAKLAANESKIAETQATIEANKLAAEAALAAAKAELEGKVAEVITSITGLEAAIKVNADAIAANAADIDAVELLIAGIDGDIEGIGIQVSENSGTIKRLQDQINVLIGEMNEKYEGLGFSLEELNAQINRPGGIVSQINTLIGQVGELEEQVNESFTALSGKIDRVAAEADAMFGSVNEKADALAEQVAANTESISGNADAIADIKATLQTLTGSTTGSFAAIEEAYKKADEALAETVKAVKAVADANKDAIKALKDSLASVNPRIDYLWNSLEKMITGIILQQANDASKEINMSFGRLVSSGADLTPGFGLTNFYTEGTANKYAFPYKGATNAKVYNVGTSLYETELGYVYLTINPTNVNFEGTKLDLVNSLGEAPVLKDANGKELGKIELTAIEKADDVLLTRSVTPDNDNASSNGLYKARVKFVPNGTITTTPVLDNALYAICASYDFTNDYDKQINRKNVYSEYALTVNVYPGNYNPYPEIKYNNASRSSYEVTGNSQASKLSATIELKHSANNTEDRDVRSSRALYKYVEIFKVTDPHGTVLTDANKIKAAKDALVGPFNKIYTVTDKEFNEIEMSLNSEEYNGYKYTIRYYVMNYYGKIYADEADFTFVKPVFDDKKITIEVTPGAATLQTIDFKKLADLSLTGDERAKWNENTVSISLVNNESSTVFAMYKEDGTLVSNVTDGTGVTGLNKATLETITKFKVSYLPSELVLGNNVFKVVSKDPNGKLIGNFIVTIVMKYDNAWQSLIKENPLYFEGRTVTAWLSGSSQLVGGNATYTLTNAYNTPWTAADGTAIRFELQNANSYNAGQPNAAYNPQSRTLVNNYALNVPVAALKKDKEHTYSFAVGVQKYGLTNLWTASAENAMNIVYKSAIAHSNFVINGGNNVDVVYPGGTVNVGLNKIKGVYPVDGASISLNHSGVQSVQLVLVDTNTASAFASYTATKTNGITITCAEQTDASAVVRGEVNFKLLVTDYFGNTIEYPFVVNVKFNGQ